MSGYKKESLTERPEDPNNAPGTGPGTGDQQMGFFTRTAIHIIGAVAGAITIFLGVLSIFTLSGLCILNAFYLMFLGFGLILLEAPICCKFWSVTDMIGEWSASLSHVVKAALYLLLPVATFFMCIGPSQIIACLLVMGVGALYGIVFIGKKGDGVKVARQQHLAGDDGSTAVKLSEMQTPSGPAGAYP